MEIPLARYAVGNEGELTDRPINKAFAAVLRENVLVSAEYTPIFSIYAKLKLIINA